MQNSQPTETPFDTGHKSASLHTQYLIGPGLRHSTFNIAEKIKNHFIAPHNVTRLTTDYGNQITITQHYYLVNDNLNLIGQQ